MRSFCCNVYWKSLWFYSNKLSTAPVGYIQNTGIKLRRKSVYWLLLGYPSKSVHSGIMTMLNMKRLSILWLKFGNLLRTFSISFLALMRFLACFPHLPTPTDVVKFIKLTLSVTMVASTVVMSFLVHIILWIPRKLMETTREKHNKR